MRPNTQRRNLYERPPTACNLVRGICTLPKSPNPRMTVTRTCRRKMLLSLLISPNVLGSTRAPRTVGHALRRLAKVDTLTTVLPRCPVFPENFIRAPLVLLGTKLAAATS
ncbi:unnamed protein product [Ectocarpus sp. 6 AP-2014]